jgi:hypothetical protein
LQALRASAVDIPELSDFCLAMHSFICSLLAVWVDWLDDCWSDEDDEEEDGLVDAGFVVEGLVLLGGGVCRSYPLGGSVWANTSATGATESNAPNKSVRRGLMKTSPHGFDQYHGAAPLLPVTIGALLTRASERSYAPHFSRTNTPAY